MRRRTPPNPYNLRRLGYRTEYCFHAPVARSNADVYQAWAEGRPARRPNLATDGANLYSYGLRIGYTTAGPNPERVVLLYPRPVSVTTTAHTSGARRYAPRVETEPAPPSDAALREGGYVGVPDHAHPVW